MLEATVFVAFVMLAAILLVALGPIAGIAAWLMLAWVAVLALRRLSVYVSKDH